jgi:cytochrome c oxidase subunit III
VQGGHDIKLVGSELVIAHAHNHDHDGHAAHDEHAAPADHAAHEEKVALDLVLNKYTLEHKDGKDLRKLSVKGEEATKLWNAMSPNTMAFGANLSKNEYGPQQYADFFFFITGFHGFHVMQGVFINIIVWLMAMRGVFEKRGHYEMVEKVGLFWHFVDLVWVFVFTFYYLV